MHITSKKWAALMGSVLAAGVVAHGSALAGKLDELEPSGETQTCLSLGQIDSITAVDKEQFLVRTGVNKYYLNRVKHGCSGAGRAGNAIQYSVSTGSLCRGEIIRIVDTSIGMTVGSCSLGDFERLVPIEAEPEAAEEE